MSQYATFPTEEQIRDLVMVHRARKNTIRNRVAQGNRLVSDVVGILDRRTRNREELEGDALSRHLTKLHKEAAKIIKGISKGDIPDDREIQFNLPYILTVAQNAAPFPHVESNYEKTMLEIVKEWPIAKWVELPEQRGFGLTGLAMLVGETQDLHNYPKVWLVWKRLGLLPWTYNGQTRMGATWKSLGRTKEKLPNDEWIQFGYNPKRRSIVYQVTSSMIRSMSKKEGEKSVYRLCYEQKKEQFKERHPDYSKGRCNNHALLCMTKKLIKELWIEWTGAERVAYVG